MDGRSEVRGLSFEEATEKPRSSLRRFLFGPPKKIETVDPPRWVIETLLVATEAALERPLSEASLRVARAYMIRARKEPHEPAVRALAATLLGILDDRSVYYVVAFFFEELRVDSELFDDELPSLAVSFEESFFTVEAALAVWLTLLPVALPEPTLLRWLDVLLVSPESLPKLAVVWFAHYEAALAGILPSASTATVVAVIRDHLAVTDPDVILDRLRTFDDNASPSSESSLSSDETSSSSETSSSDDDEEDTDDDDDTNKKDTIILCIEDDDDEDPTLELPAIAPRASGRRRAPRAPRRKLHDKRKNDDGRKWRL